MSQPDYSESFAQGQTAFNPLPAVVIGGPPHSGKSVLTYGLTQALRARGVDHYVIRAYPPDGEGDWFLQGEPGTVRHLRVKGARSEAWLGPLLRDVAARHLPLIVDMGGLPTAEQARVLDVCTHGILLTPDAASHRAWAHRFAHHGLVLLADLHSELAGEGAVTARRPVLQGTLAGLDRAAVREGTGVQGPAFDALAQGLAARFAAATAGRDGAGLRRRHLAAAPVELAVDLAPLARTLGHDPRAWPPAALPAVLDYLPAATPLGLYGRGPNWLYGAVAAHAMPAPFHLFDVRRGWVRAPDLAVVPDAEAAATPPPPIAVTVTPHGAAALVAVRLLDAYLDLEDAAALRLPAVPWPRIILSGKLPHWLWAGLARAYRSPWLALHQPQLGGAVVVRGDVGTVMEVKG
jgi:CRISPR-associated protein Csx3